MLHHYSFLKVISSIFFNYSKELSFSWVVTYFEDEILKHSTRVFKGTAEVWSSFLMVNCILAAPRKSKLLLPCALA